MADAVNNFSVDYFVSTIKASGARSNLFSCNLTLPTEDVKLSMNNDETDKLDFLVNATVMPGYINGEIPVSYFGRQVFFAGDTTFGDWTCTVLNDESMTFWAPKTFVFTASNGLYSVAGTCLRAAAWITISTPSIALVKRLKSLTSPIK